MRRSLRVAREDRWERTRSLRAATVVVEGIGTESVSDGSAVVKRRVTCKSAGEGGDAPSHARCCRDGPADEEPRMIGSRDISGPLFVVVI